ncbi:5014_t:CDS:2, partial [Ambispora leptoticha]
IKEGSKLLRSNGSSSLGSIPSNRYPPNRIELENQLAYNKRMQYDLNRSNKDKEKLFKHSCQLINEVKRLKVDNTNLTSQITRSQISRDEYKA